MRDHRADIAALLRSGHVEAGGALPLSQRVQTSGRGEPQLPRSSEAAERAQRILGRGYAEGGQARRCALALWLTYAYGAHPASALAIGLGVVLDTEADRHETVKHWQRWGDGGSADELAASGVALVGLAIGWYETASDEPGHAGVLAQLVTAADAVHCEGGVVERLREWHRRWIATREPCTAARSKRVRCRGTVAARAAAQDTPRCVAARPHRSRSVCSPWHEECGVGWAWRCAA